MAQSKQTVITVYQTVLSTELKKLNITMNRLRFENFLNIFFNGKTRIKTFSFISTVIIIFL